MGKLVFVVGKSGMGKSTSLRNLNPDETVIINTDQKPLPFKKFEEKYNEGKGNYLKTSDVSEVIKKLKEIHKNPKIKTVIVDTWSRIMTDAIMNPSFRAEKGFDKQYGARPLKRAIQRYIEDSLAQEIVNSKLSEGDTIAMDLDEKSKELTIKIKKGKKPVE